MKQTLFTLFTLFIFAATGNSQSVVEWTLSERPYGISQKGFEQVVKDARSHFSTSPNDSLIIKIDEGTYEIGGDSIIYYGINLDGGIKPGLNGRLIFEGAGMNKTTLVFTDMTSMISGRRLYRLEFKDLHFTRSRHTTTQGYVVSTAPGELVLDIAEGFPSPLDVFGYKGYLKRFSNSKTDPLMDDSRQIPFGNRNGGLIYPEHLGGNRWKIFLNQTGYNPGTAANAKYKEGDLIGMRCKFDGNAFRNAVDGDDIVFRNVKWTHSTRVALLACSNAKVIGCRIERVPINGQMPCLASTAGGPQMYTDGILVEDCFFDSPGDDPIAIYHSNQAIVRNVHLRNALGRLYIYTDSRNVCLDNITLDNIPISAWIMDPDSAVRQEFTYDPNDEDFYAAVEAREPGKIVRNCDESTTGVINLENKNNIKLQVDHNKNLIISSEEEMTNIRLFDTSGALLFESSNVNENIYQLNTEKLKGVIILAITSDKSISSKKILLQ